MNKVYKIIVSACCIILTVLITVRVIYVNKEIYSSPVERNYNTGEEFEYDGMIMKLSEYKVYRGEELNSMYNNELTGIVDENDILFNLTITNKSNEKKNYNASASGLMYGYESGGNVNPYLYKYFNPEHQGIVQLNPNETCTITLAFPCVTDCSNIKYIVSLYPENIKVKLNKPELFTKHQNAVNNS